MYNLVYIKNGEPVMVEDIQVGEENHSLLNTVLYLLLEEFNHTDIIFSVEDKNGNVLFSNEDGL